MNVRNIENFGYVIMDKDFDNSKFDFYCCPDRIQLIHDKYGSRAVDDFFNMIISELEKYSSQVFRVSLGIFTIPDSSNAPEFITINFNSEQYILNRRIVTITNI